MRLAPLISALFFFLAGSLTFAAAKNPATVTVPLYIVNAAATPADGPEYMVGIKLRLGDHSDSGYRLYEFDTGGTGFYAAHTADDDWDERPSSPDILHMNYMSGNVFTAQIVRTTVAFESGISESGTPAFIKESKSELAMIMSATNAQASAEDPFNRWSASIAAGQPPLHRQFYGNFGANLKKRNGLCSLVPQLPGNLNTGFIVNLGPYPGAGHAPDVIQQGSLQIGLSKSDRDPAHWSVVIPMIKSTGSYPISRQKLYAEALSDGHVAVGSFSTAAQIIYDTGTPDTVIFDHSGAHAPLSLAKNGQIAPGLSFALHGANGALVFAFTTGSARGSNVVRLSIANNSVDATNVNTGIGAFWGRRVVFDLADGFVGLAPAR